MQRRLGVVEGRQGELEEGFDRPHVSASVVLDQETADSWLLFLEVGVERHAPAVFGNDLARHGEETARNVVAQVMHDAEGDDQIDSLEVGSRYVLHSGDEEAAPIAEPPPRHLDVPRTRVESDVVDVGEVLEDVAGAAADVEDTVTRLRSYVLGHEHALDLGFPEALLVPAVERGACHQPPHTGFTLALAWRLARILAVDIRTQGFLLPARCSIRVTKDTRSRNRRGRRASGH